MIGAIVVALVAVVHAAPPAVDVVPVLTSTPFGAAPGRPVSHSITLAGTGTGVVSGVTVTFTTTVGLDGVTATASRGSCPVTTARKVVCELADVAYPGAAVTVTVTGTVHPATPPGTLVQNLVTVTAPDADPGDNVASNAYLVAGASTGATGVPVGPPSRAPASRVPVAAAVLGLAALATGVGLWWVLRNRRRER